MMAIHPQMLEWGQRYWGGCVAVLGGCLVTGAFGRILAKGKRKKEKGKSEVGGSAAAERLLAGPARCDSADVGACVAPTGSTGEPPVLRERLLAGAHVLPAGCAAAQVGTVDSHEEITGEPPVLREDHGQVARATSSVRVTFDSILLAAGLFILAISRPYEGFVLGAVLVIWLLLSVKRAVIWRMIVPMAIVLAPAMAWLGYYNYRVVGNPLRLPYVEHQSQYGVVPLFMFQKKKSEPTYHSDAVRLFHVREQGYEYLPFTLKLLSQKTFGLFQTVFGNAESLALTMLLLPWMFVRSRRMRGLIIVMLIFWAALMFERFLFGHYAAPVAGICLVLIIAAMRLMWRSSPRLGRLLVRCMVSVFVLFAIFWWIGFFNWKIGGWALRKADIARDLAKDGGRHIVFVQYDLRRPIIPWTRVMAEVAWNAVCRGEPERFALSTEKGLPQNKPPIAGEGRTIWLSEEGVELETYWNYMKLWPDREWWRLELHGDDETTVLKYRRLADRYIRMQPGNHLVFFRVEKDKDDDGIPVRPGPCRLRRLIRTHDVHQEWVYNPADLPGAAVIWARDLGAQKNAELLRAYPGRKAWIINPDVDLNGPREYSPVTR